MRGTDDDVLTLAATHLKLVACRSGFWELRSLRRSTAGTMEARGSQFLIATATTDGLTYGRLDEVLDWAIEQDVAGAEVFIGMNPRAGAGRDKASVEVMSCCFPITRLFADAACPPPCLLDPLSQVSMPEKSGLQPMVDGGGQA